MKAILITGDGMADRPVKTLNWKTPLQLAKKKNMDTITQNGISGIMDVLAPGIPPGSDTAHLALFGYDPYKVYRGRGAFEALGVGISLRKGDIAFRCNLATIDSSGKIIDRRAGRIDSADARKLAETLKKVDLPRHRDVEIIVEPATEHRIAVILRGKGLSSQITDSDPHETGVAIQKVKPLVSSPEAIKTSNVVNELTQTYHEILKNHPLNKERKEKGSLPANVLLFRGAGELPEIEPLSQKYGIKPAVISGTALIKGVCRSLGMGLIKVDGATGTTETNVLAKAEAAVKTLKNHDFVYVHVKGTDNASHDGNPHQKIQMIGRIDLMIGEILSKVDRDDTIIAITADHTTPVEIKEHTGDPVPLSIVGPGVRRDKAEFFDEISCTKGGLNRIRGIDLFPTLMNLIGKTQKFGA